MRKITKKFIEGEVYSDLHYRDVNSTYLQFVKIDLDTNGIYFKYVGGVDCYNQTDGLCEFHYPACSAFFLVSKREVNTLLSEGVIKL